MPPEFWLTGVLGPHSRDQKVIRWATEPGLLVPLPTGIRWDTEPGLLVPLPTGIRWDTVRMPADLGSAVLAELLAVGPAERIGPVVLDERTGHTYWLTMTGTKPDDRWSRLHPGVDLLEHGTVVDIPNPSPDPLLAHFAQPLEVPARVTWAHWPVVTGTLTPPVWLAGALDIHRRNSALRA